MSQQSMGGNGVHIAGSFQGWNPSTTVMNSLGSGVFTVSIDLAPGVYEYKFINGNAWGFDEVVPVGCGVDNGFGSFNRSITVGAFDEVLDLPCFGQCLPCLTGQSYFLNGTASDIGGDCYRITADLATENGTVWYANQVDLSRPFDVEFLLNFGVNDFFGADGCVFVLQRLGTSAIGLSGGGMGFQSFTSSFGVEFDTFENPEFGDPWEDHLGIQINGSVDHFGPEALVAPVPMSATNNDVEDGQDHIVRLRWQPDIFLFEVYFDCELRIQLTSNIAVEVFSGNQLVYWGFTGATGLYSNEQRVCLQPQALQVNEYSICPGGSVVLSGGSSLTGSYSWSPVSFLDSPTIANPEASPPASTLYEVEVVTYCNEIEQRQVQVNVLDGDAICALLTIDLLHFAAVLNPFGVLLSWQVQNELDGRYGIEFKTENGSWTPLATNLMAGNGSYTTTAIVPPGWCLFRLRLETADGPVHYFNEYVEVFVEGEHSARIVERSGSHFLEGNVPKGSYQTMQYTLSGACFGKQMHALDGFFSIPLIAETGWVILFSEKRHFTGLLVPK